MPLNKLIDSNFLEYASYVIKDRAIPDINDGLKPVQRRIFHSLNEMDDGKFSKVANIIGHCMRYHPHGDASIGDAMVVLANKEYFIEKQGNFGNIFTGDSASAARYIEARLTPLARDVLFNRLITEYTDSYDGRNKEPVTLPAKVPVLLMMGAEGIAVGMSTRILPHNFVELLKGQISYLRGEEFRIYPDFLQGGIVDATEYKDGRGKIRCRAVIEVHGRKLVVREVPFSTTVDSLIASIEDAVRKGKIKATKINDFTTSKVEIDITLMRSVEPHQVLEQLYLYTDCEVSISSNILVIKDGMPLETTVTHVVGHTSNQLVNCLKRELELELATLNEKHHMMILEQIFIEHRLYKKIENCETYPAVKDAVLKSFKRFKKQIIHEVTDDNIELLLSIRIKRISRFDIDKHEGAIDQVVVRIAEIAESLGRIIEFSIEYIEAIIEKYGSDFPRKSKIESFKKVNAAEVATPDIEVMYDRKKGYLGTEVKDGKGFRCTAFDKVILFDHKMQYRVIAPPEKLFTGKLHYADIYNPDAVFNLLYKDRQTGYLYIKRFAVGKYITDKTYLFAGEHVKIETFTTNPDCYIQLFYEPGKRIRKTEETFTFNNYLVKSVKAQGVRISSKKVVNIKIYKQKPA